MNHMDRFVALFRGVNVGGNNILPMNELKCILEDNLYHNPKTYIQSGNVVFDSEKPPENIALLIEEKYGFKPEILIINKEEFLELVNGNPYSSPIGKQIHFWFFKGNPKANIEKLDGLKSGTEQYFINGKVLYLYAPDGIGRSKLAANIEKCMGVPATGRNLNTVNKLIEMLERA